MRITSYHSYVNCLRLRALCKIYDLGRLAPNKISPQMIHATTQLNFKSTCHQNTQSSNKRRQLPRENVDRPSHNRECVSFAKHQRCAFWTQNEHFLSFQVLRTFAWLSNQSPCYRERDHKLSKTSSRPTENNEKHDRKSVTAACHSESKKVRISKVRH